MFKCLRVLGISSSRLFIAAALALNLVTLPDAASAKDVTLLNSGGLPVYSQLEGALLARLESYAKKTSGKQITSFTATAIDLSREAPSPAQLRNSDLLIAIGARAYESALNAGVPVVGLLVNAPLEGAGAKENVTGVRMTLPPASWLAATGEAFPSRRRIGLLHSTALAGWVGEARAALEGQGFKLTAIQVESGREVALGLKELAGATDLYWMLPDARLLNSETVESLSLFSLENRVPILTFSEKFLKTGATAALVPDLQELAAQGADLVREILENNGRPPLPQPQNPRGSLRLNAAVAEKLGIRIAAPPEGRKQ